MTKTVKIEMLVAHIFQLYSTPQKRGRLKRRWTEITWRLRCFTMSTVYQQQGGKVVEKKTEI